MQPLTAYDCLAAFQAGREAGRTEGREEERRRGRESSELVARGFEIGRAVAQLEARREGSHEGYNCRVRRWLHSRLRSRAAGPRRPYG